MKGCLLFVTLLAALLFGCVAPPFQYGAHPPSSPQANNSTAPAIIYRFICADGSEAVNASGCPAANQTKTMDEMVKECNGDDCLIALAIQYENPGICSSAIFSENCYSTLAMRFKNRGYCALGYNAEQCYAAYDRAYPSAANSTQNKSVEELYAACGTDAGCVTTLAVQADNPALCARLTSIMNGINHYNENNCYAALAARYSNKAYCALIVGDSLLSQNCNDGLGK